MIELSDLFVFVLIAALVMYWWQSLAAKEIAVRGVQRYCDNLGIQFLDCSIALHRFWFARDESGALRLKRSYQFEFSSTGELRYSGNVIMLGRKIDSISSEPHRVEHEDPPLE